MKKPKRRKISDKERLDWMIEHGAHVSWGRDGDMYSVRWSEALWGDGVYNTGREAIDAAMRRERAR